MIFSDNDRRRKTGDLHLEYLLTGFWYSRHVADYRAHSAFMCIHAVARPDLANRFVCPVTHQHRRIRPKARAVDETVQVLQRNILRVFILRFEEFDVAAMTQAGRAGIGLEVKNVVDDILIAVDLQGRPFNCEASVYTLRLRYAE